MSVGEEHSGRTLGVALGTCHIAGLADVDGMDYRQQGVLDMRDHILLVDVCLASICDTPTAEDLCQFSSLRASVRRI